MARPVVGIVGARALRKDLSRLADDQTGPLYQAMKQAGGEAAEPVAAATRAALPHVTGTLAGDVRTSATKTGAAVRMGRKTVPYAGPVEFGGYPRPAVAGRTVRWRQGAFRTELGEEVEGGRPFIRTGRYLFPAARGLAEQSARSYSDALAQLFERSDIWTNTTADGSAVHD